MYRNIVIIVLCIIVVACTPEKKLRRLLNKHPELLNKVDTVTVIESDTFIIESILVDTAFSTSIDSITVEKDKIRVVYRKIRDSIYLTSEYLGDTIVKLDTLYVETKTAEVRKPTLWEEIRGWLPLIIIIALIVIFRSALKKLFKL